MDLHTFFAFVQPQKKKQFVLKKVINIDLQRRAYFHLKRVLDYLTLVAFCPWDH